MFSCSIIELPFWNYSNEESCEESSTKVTDVIEITLSEGNELIELPILNRYMMIWRQLKRM